MLSQVSGADGTPLPGQGRTLLDDQAELVDGYFADWQRLAEGGDDGCSGLPTGAITQRHVGNPGQPGGAGDTGVSSDLESGGLGGFEDRGQSAGRGHGQQDACGVVN